MNSLHPSVTQTVTKKGPLNKTRGHDSRTGTVRDADGDGREQRVGVASHNA